MGVSNFLKSVWDANSKKLRNRLINQVRVGYGHRMAAWCDFQKAVRQQFSHLSRVIN